KFLDELQIDQSVAHDGVCLTVDSLEKESYSVVAVAETLEKTNLKSWEIGDLVNLERAMLLNGRLDGHLVQGHVDALVKCEKIVDKNGSVDFTFSFDEKFAALVIEKGSICLNGVSLTVFNVGNRECTVTIIPYTIEHTNFKNIKEGDLLNVEFDVIGKYILRKKTLS
ncbi:MAG TPA: riboflavin synthase, partial [Chitinophagaceae bacterium]|nr:riboflavin synthase [Chitinophagaceae bacterium]